MEELIISNLETYGLLAVIIWMFIEEIVPVPSALAPMAAAIVLVNTSDPINAFITIFFIVAILGSIASVASSYITYSLGYYGGKPGIERFGKYIGLNWKQVQKSQDYLIDGKEHLYIATFRAVPLMPLSVISATSGFLRINWKTYGTWSLIGMIPRNLILGMTAWYLKEDFTQAITIIGQATALTTTLILIILIITIGKRSQKVKNLEKRIFYG